VAATVIKGHVVDQSGAPVAGARVMVSASPVPLPDIAQITGPDGGFALAAPAPGRYSIVVHAAGLAMERAVDVRESTITPHLEIMLRSAP